MIVQTGLTVALKHPSVRAFAHVAFDCFPTTPPRILYNCVALVAEQLGDSTHIDRHDYDVALMMVGDELEVACQ